VIRLISAPEPVLIGRHCVTLGESQAFAYGAISYTLLAAFSATSTILEIIFVLVSL